MKKILFLAGIFLLPVCGFLTIAQETFPVNGVADKRQTTYVFKNARIQTDHQTVIENGMMIVRNGLIVEVGSSLAIPAGAIVYDLKGKTIYPSFIDPYTTYGMPEVKRAERPRGPQMESNTKGAYGWNQAIRPETEADKLFISDPKSAEDYRKNGFGAVMAFRRDGIARGTGVAVTLSNQNENLVILKDRVAALYSFSKGTSTQDYPSSLMGSIALLRQTYYDAQWYAKQPRLAGTEFNISLDAWNKSQTLPQIFECGENYNGIRADKIGDEFGIQYILKGNGDEYQCIDDIKSTKAAYILPLKFPSAYDVEDPYDAQLVSYAELKHWEMAPLNPAAFEKNNIVFALTTDGLRDKKEFWKNLRKAIEYGLSEKAALRALTQTPAELLGLQNQVGALRKGMVANFLITSGNIFDEKTVIYENWVQGEAYILKDKNIPDLRGNYKLTAGNSNYQLKLTGEAEKPRSEVLLNDSVKAETSFQLNESLVSISYKFKKDPGLTRLSGTLGADQRTMKGRGQTPSGEWFDWMVEFATSAEAKKDSAKKDKSAEKDLPTLADVIYPFNAYGMKRSDTTLVEKNWNRWDAILIRNVTVWTNEADGILTGKDVLISGGKIAAIGTNLSAGPSKNVKIIDGTGLHLTPGIIDEHSHIAIESGVNEGAQASSAEVRIGDVIDNQDINIYRNLSGGVVAVQQLHGSANPIGGQSALIKLRWGMSPEQMKIAGADGFIKFALGENVKQSNWGDNNTVRFPQTRMGVEQVYYDHFTRARDYYKKLQAPSPSGPLVRRDLELDALAEILNKKRFISCHSYVQSEINMLMHVGDSMGFRVNTFTHILEGYKVADKMKAHGAGGSSFSDWWAYKMEVKDAIPYNGAILHKAGVLTAFNSDDAEMSRRLNTEAAKAVKYGGLSEQEAFKFVTLNPAKLLHLDKQMGSIQVGKSADIVIWTDHPMSIYAKADKTIIDGLIYFDLALDAKLREEIRRERARIIQLLIQAKKGGEPTVRPERREKKAYSCHAEQEL